MPVLNFLLLVFALGVAYLSVGLIVAILFVLATNYSLDDSARDDGEVAVMILGWPVFLLILSTVVVLSVLKEITKRIFK